MEAKLLYLFGALIVLVRLILHHDILTNVQFLIPVDFIEVHFFALIEFHLDLAF